MQNAEAKTWRETAETRKPRKGDAKRQEPSQCGVRKPESEFSVFHRDNMHLFLLRNRKRHRERRGQMKTLRDCFGRQVRLTDERLAHILDHPEMKEMGAELERMLLQPQFVRRSRSDQAVRLFYEFYAQTIVGGKWLCVVVKYAENDAFVVTAYLTDKPKAGEDLWPTK